MAGFAGKMSGGNIKSHLVSIVTAGMKKGKKFKFKGGTPALPNSVGSKKKPPSQMTMKIGKSMIQHMRNN